MDDVLLYHRNVCPHASKHLSEVAEASANIQNAFALKPAIPYILQDMMQSGFRVILTIRVQRKEIWMQNRLIKLQTDYCLLA